MLDNQTLQDKYPHLEVSMLKLSEVKKDNESFRIDSEYFKKEYLENEKRIKTNYVLLGNIIELLTDGKHGGVTLTDSGVLFLKNTNIEEGIIKIDEKLFISEEESSQTKRAEVKEGNILLSTVGTVGLSAVVPKGFPRATINQNLVKIVLKQGYSSYFISTFFNSYYGKYQIIRMSAGNIYQMINYPNLRKIKIPIFPMSFQLEIERLVKDSHKALESSKALYKEAEALLYEALGLDPKNPLQSILNTHANRSSVIARSEMTKQSIYRNIDCHKFDKLNSCNDEAAIPNYTIATLRESFLKTGRLDAEYYKSKYDDIERFIKNYRGGYLRLTDIVEVVNGSFIPEAFYTQKAQRAYIRIKELSLNAPIKISECIYIKDDFIASNEVIVKENDFVIATIGNTIGKVNLVPKELEGSFISNNTSRLRLINKNYIPEFMELLLRSMFVQEQIQRNFTQTAQPKISNTSLENILIPKIDSTTQTQIAAHIQKSFELRAEAKKLLESAKAEVESALNDTNNGGGGKALLEQIKAKLKESKRFYRLAQWLLIETLCFNDVDFTPCDKANILDLQVWSSTTHTRHKFDKSNSRNDKIASPNYTIRTLANSLKESGRLDAEYYQSKYEKNEALLKNYKYGFCKLKDLIQRQSSGFAFSSDEYVDCSDLVLIRINNIKNATLDMSNAVYLKNEAQNLSPKDKVYKGDILISMSGSIGVSCVVRDDINAMLNQRIYKIAIRGFSPDVLAVFLNSVCAKLQFERIGTGGVQTNISSSDIQNLIIPLLDFKTQEAIESKISQSFALKAKSKELLESAKQRVEEAIVSKKI